MQHRSLRIALASLAAALTVVTTAAAVTGSTPDGDAHPYVGALVVDGAVACSGVLVAPTVFATAGHCGADGARVAVSFDAALGDGWSLLEGTLDVDSSKRSDLAVVVLDAPAGAAPATLPAAGRVALLGKGDVVTSVGYGYHGRDADGNWLYDGLRRAADSPLLKVGKSSLTLSTADGGPCMGDSGGPQLDGDTVLSLTSTGSKDCSGKAEAYRLDTAAARAFLGDFVALP
ncbi:MAG TPA: trypsin-like serine protease [Gaiellaceae bacterium]|nr:trypsin-like serine protease [Gaiellaceae bacterium]